MWRGAETSGHHTYSQGATSLLRVGAARGANKHKYKAGFESTEKVKKVITLMGERIKDCFK